MHRKNLLLLIAFAAGFFAAGTASPAPTRFSTDPSHPYEYVGNHHNYKGEDSARLTFVNPDRRRVLLSLDVDRRLASSDSGWTSARVVDAVDVKPGLHSVGVHISVRKEPGGFAKPFWGWEREIEFKPGEVYELVFTFDQMNYEGSLELVNTSEQFKALSEAMSRVPRELSRKAQSGDAEAMYRLAEWYQQRGDAGQAASWTRKAADAGNPEAQATVGWAHLTGRGAERDPDTARTLLAAAAKRDEPLGMFGWGVMLFSGQAVTRDAAAGEKWIRAAGEAAKGPHVQFLIANFYYEFSEIFDSRQAITLYRRAADQGHQGARRVLQQIE